MNSVVSLRVSEPFSQLTDKEKLYAHHMSKAVFASTRIILRQVSPESEAIFDLILEVAKACRCNWASLAQVTKASPQVLAGFLKYAALVLESLGNYQGYGDKKILPNISSDDFALVCSCSPVALQIFKAHAAAVFDPEPSTIGFPAEGGMSSFYSGPNVIQKDEVEKIQAFLMERGYMLQNTRLSKSKAGLTTTFRVHIMSEETQAKPEQQERYLPLEYGADSVIDFEFGDNKLELATIRAHLSTATEYAANATEQEYLIALSEFLLTGNIEEDKKACKSWLKNTSPVVEASIGFLTGYRDPAGVRRSFEGLVAIRDKKGSAAVEALISMSEDILRRLPWIPDSVSADEPLGPFELAVYVRPSFVNLQLLAFAGVEVWLGMMGPTARGNFEQYQDIRDAYGKKNLFFGNRMAPITEPRSCPFLSALDIVEFLSLHESISSVMTSTHELIGHGCGKVLSETGPSSFNFDPQNLPTSPVTGEKIKTWYLLGQTPKSVFKGLYSTLSEAIADLVSLFLLPQTDILRALNAMHRAQDIDILTFEYFGYLWMLNLGLGALAQYDLSRMKWGQSHARARFAIFKHLVTEGGGVVTIDHHKGVEEKAPAVTIILHKELIPTHGRRAVTNLLLRLHLYKCTGDSESGIPDLENLTKVDGEWLDWHAAVMARQDPPALVVLPNTILSGDRGNDAVPTLKEYPATFEGLVTSWAERVFGPLHDEVVNKASSEEAVNKASSEAGSLSKV